MGLERLGLLAPEAREEEGSRIPDDNPLRGWRQSRDWLLVQPRLDGSPEVGPLPGDTGWEGMEAAHSHLREPPLKRFRLAECISLAEGLEP